MNALFFGSRRATRAIAWASATVLLLSFSFSSLLYQTQVVQAAELTSRSITLASSVENAETNYTLGFTIPAGSTVGTVLVEFCNNDPIPSTACTFTAVGDDIPEVDGVGAGNIATESGTDVFAFTNSTGGNCDGATLTAPSDGDHWLEINCTAADAFGGSASVFSGTVNDVDNPSNSTSTNPNDTFYARVYTYSVINPTAPTQGSGNTVSQTSLNNEAGLALSTAEQLTVTARVQEILEFCVGTAASAGAMPADCSAMTGNAIDLGVVDFGDISYSEADEDNKGQVMVRTNAASGVTIGYLAEQASTGTNHLGALRVSGASCNAGDVQTDQCFKDVGTTQTQMVAGTEEWGLCVDAIDTSSSTGTPTANLSINGDYDGACDNSGAAAGFAFDETGTLDALASSGTVVNDEGIELEFAATSAVTTPTGTYTAVLTFVGTSTF